MVSVIIPMFNAENTIKSCIDSVLKQTFKGKVEIIVVNDGSTDKSQVIVEELMRRNNSNINIQLINKENGGVSKARNTGLRISKGDYIALLDSDDEWLENKLDIQIPFLKDSSRNIDFIASNRNNEKTTFPYKIKDDQYAEITLKKLLFKIVGQTSTAIFKNKILKNTGYFDENQKYSEDANYWLRISIKNRMVLLSESLVITGGGKPAVGFSGLSSNVEAMEKGVQKNIKEMFISHHINIFEYVFFVIFSRVKYLKRILTLKIKK